MENLDPNTIIAICAFMGVQFGIIYFLLTFTKGSIEKDIAQLETKLEKRIDSLEAGQAKLEAGQAKLEAGQAKLAADLDKMFGLIKEIVKNPSNKRP